jgi:WXG100 family type VII secretion target
MPISTTGQVVGALDRAAGLVASAKADLDGLLGSLGGQVALGSRWQGGGARAFTSAYAEWARQQARVTASLQWFHDQLAAVERLNTATDDAQAASLSSLAHRLDPTHH